MGLGDIFEEAWDFIIDGTEYFFSFEWFGDAWDGIIDFFSSMFEGIGEFSFLGLTFGILTVLFSYLTKFLNFTGADKQMTLIASMTQFMPPGERILWTVVSYLGAFIAGYLLGKHFENT